MAITYKEYNEKYRLPEQEKDEKLLMKYKHFALCYEPGKGKSFPVIHCIREVNKLKNGKAKVLILSDATCIREMWKAEIEPQGILPKETYFCTDRTAIGKVKDALVATNWDLIVCDECQSLRSGVTRAKSQYAKLVYQLTKRAEYVFGMTGTIAGNNNIEPFCVLHNLHIAGMGEINCHYFKTHYCVNELQYGPFGSFQKPTRLNDLGEKLMTKAYLDGCSFWDYDENDGMPEMNINYKTFIVPKTTHYEEALQGILKCGESESTVLKAIAIQKAQQALNGFLYYNVDAERNTFIVPDFHNPKVDYIVEQCKKEAQVIAYRFQEDETLIRQALDKAGLKYTLDIAEFKRRRLDGELISLILQCSKGKSFNLQDVCQNIIYYTSDFSFIAFKQFIHRCWRRGQLKPCNVTFLINEVEKDKDHIEKKIWDSLQKKQSIHQLLMSIKRSD